MSKVPRLRRHRAPAALAATPIEIDESGEELAYQQLSLRAPHDGSVLVANLSARLPAGTRTLVTAPGEASIALFRATAGLWDAGEGRIVRPPADDILFLTERPYLPPGTLRQALLPTGREHELASRSPSRAPASSSSRAR